MSIEVKCKITIYEVNGSDETSDIEKSNLSVESHWNSADSVNVVLNGKQLTVGGSDLIRAVENAMHTK